MRITRLYLRNYRVYEDELNLEIPAGLVGIYGSNGAGKCLPGPTRVWDAETGEGVSIEQFVHERRKWMLGFTGGRVAKVQVTDWHDMGDKPTTVVKLASGAEIETATTHPILTDRGCVRAEDIRIGDWVAEAAQLPEVSPPSVSNNEALILGMLLGDGCVTSTVRLSAKDPDVTRAFRDAVEAVFPHCTLRTAADGVTHLVVSGLSAVERRNRRRALARRLHDAGVPLNHYMGSNAHRFVRGEASPGWEMMEAIEADHGLDLWDDRCALHGGRAMAEWASFFGLVGHDFSTKRVPPALILLPDSQVAHLLAGLWLTDGYISDIHARKRSRKSNEVSYTTGSPGLADDVRALLLRLGMGSTRRERLVGGKPSHTVAVTSGSFAKLEQLPLVGPKARRAQELREVRAADELTVRPLHDLLPPSFNSTLASPSPSGRSRTQKQMTRHAMSRRVYLDFGGDPEVASAETRWSKVVSVTPTGKNTRCFDVTVDTPEHLYLADTFIVHNSYLVDSIRWTLYGKSRTSVDDVRSTGVGGECVTEVEFEHESHLYLIRRTISGINHTVRAEAHWNNQMVAEGSRDVATYVQSVLGMDDASFRASVFAEQKQVAAFSDQTPQKRRDLVLRLLGITPLDKAREAARADARAARSDHERLQVRLPDLGELTERVRDAEATAVAAEEKAVGSAEAAEAARKGSDEADAAFERIDDLRRAHEDLVADGRTVREALDAATEQVARSEGELADLAGAASRLAELGPLAAELPAMEQRLRVVEAVVAAEAALARIPHIEAPAPPDEEAVSTTRQKAQDASDAAADAKGRLAAAEADLARARQVVSATEALEGEADCPVCGQELGSSFARAQEHRAREVAEADANAGIARKAQVAATNGAAKRNTERDAAEAALATARKAGSAYEVAAQRRSSVEERLAETLAAAGSPPEPGEIEHLRSGLPRHREAADEVQRLAGRLERRPAVEAEFVAATERADDARLRRKDLLAQVAAIGFKADDLTAARAARDEARRSSRVADDAASHAKVTAVGARAASGAAADLLQRGHDDHAAIADLAETSRHVGRLADLLSDFRNQVVQTVGPRLAVQAAELFGELTDHEYDRLEVDPETYDIQIRDAGRLHRMDRFSGSETDLANLALRVAISEHVRFQSGGAVGLLVLDEVFGPLDSDRKERMLLALERLRGRFRQVLVVTHDAEIKEQLPSAIEVIKLPGRRATARVLTGV